jgi:3-deoxy-D-manno-octulosonate 8-phosphate phosphatase (KDO 8-P phosphatase)
MIKLLILDVDGVLTDGTKVYDEKHNVLSKRYMCKDFTAIKRFIAGGVKVVFVSGDIFNETMANKRNIDFYCSRGSDLSLDKSPFLKKFEKKYKISIENMAFVGDDYFDLSIIKKINYSYCPSDSPQIVKDNCTHTLTSIGGNGVVVELYDLLVGNQFEEPSEEDVIELDKQETSSEEMS